MAANKDSFILYCKYIHQIEKISDEQAGKLFKHILRYVNDLNPVIDDLIIDLLFEGIKQDLKTDLKKWEATCKRNQENGSKGGRPKNPDEPKKPSGFSKNPDKPKKPDSDCDGVYDDDYEKKIDYIYSIYPSRCPTKNTSTGKTIKNKDKIKLLLEKYTSDELVKKINDYVNECKMSRTFIKNFGTFLNNIPDDIVETSQPPYSMPTKDEPYRTKARINPDGSIQFI